MSFTRMFVFLVLLLSLCWSLEGSIPQSPTPKEPEWVTVFQLITTPEKFDGKLVAVTGFLELGRERDFFYLHQEDYKNGIVENALGIDRTKQMGAEKSSLNLKYVTVVAVFRSNHRTIAPPNRGTLTSVESCRFWSDPDHPFRERIRELPGGTSD